MADPRRGLNIEEDSDNDEFSIAINQALQQLTRQSLNSTPAVEVEDEISSDNDEFSIGINLALQQDSSDKDDFSIGINLALQQSIGQTLKQPPAKEVEDEDATIVPPVKKFSEKGISVFVAEFKARWDTGRLTMALSEVDLKFLGQFARNVESDNALLSKTLYQLVGNFTMAAPWIVRARKQLREEVIRDGNIIQDWERVVWYAKEALILIEERALPMVATYTELKVLVYKLRASCYHLFTMFKNQPAVFVKSGKISTPPGLKSPRTKLDKGKGIDRGIPTPPTRPSSIQPTHPLEGGPVGGTRSAIYLDDTSNFLIPTKDWRPIALDHFQQANAMAEKLLWGSHPIRLSLKVEFCAFLYDCLLQRDQSRQLAKATIAEVYNAQEGMDDEMFEEAALLVGLLGKMARRGLGSAGGSGGTGSEGARTGTASPGPARFGQGQGQQVNVDSPGMDNPI